MQLTISQNTPKNFRQKVTLAIGRWFAGSHWSRPLCFKTGRIVEGFCEIGIYFSPSEELHETARKEKCWCKIPSTHLWSREDYLMQSWTQNHLESSEPMIRGGTHRRRRVGGGILN